MQDNNAYPQLYKLALDRFSCRSYSSDPIERDTLMAVLDVARLAPSACNRQPWQFIIASTDAQRQAILRAYPREWVATAPEFIVACGLHDEAWHRPHDGKDHTDIDVAIAVEHICLAATAVGLATCWICHFDPKVISEEFGLPEGVEPIAIIPIGYPAAGTVAPLKNRKKLDEIVK